eukprot:Skav236007  [mRNA]  locus=scaffold1815:63872:64576:- [translate_table: standard]
MYKRWKQAAWAKCKAKDSNTRFVSVWKDAGYRCYTGLECNPGGEDRVRSYSLPPIKMADAGSGHCSSGQIYSSRAWELAPSSVGTKGFDTKKYKEWIQLAWAKCLQKNANTKYVSVWKDAGYRCYTDASCSPGGEDRVTSWSPLVKMNKEGKGHCSKGHIYASRAWALAPKSGGKKDFDSKAYDRWLQAAWKLCKAKSSKTKFVSVWRDAGYRCYTSRTCKPGSEKNVRSWSPA